MSADFHLEQQATFTVGDYLGGLASGSLRVWWWLAFAWAGSLLGVRARSALAMDPPAERA